MKTTTAYLAELLGTFIFILLGAGSVAVNAATNGSLGLIGIAFAHGLGILAMVYAFGHVSGAHLNPAVTIALWITKRIETQKAASYILMQLTGASLAAVFIQGFFTPNSLEALKLASDITPTLGIVIEAVLTFILVMTIFGAALDQKSHAQIAGVAIGLVIAAIVLVGGPLTGASVNPARAFGPAFIAGDWTNHLVWWIGPIIGGSIAALIHEMAIMRRR